MRYHHASRRCSSFFSVSFSAACAYCLNHFLACRYQENTCLHSPFYYLLEYPTQAPILVAACTWALRIPSTTTHNFLSTIFYYSCPNGHWHEFSWVLREFFRSSFGRRPAREAFLSRGFNRRFVLVKGKSPGSKSSNYNKNNSAPCPVHRALAMIWNGSGEVVMMQPYQRGYRMQRSRKGRAGVM